MTGPRVDWTYAPDPMLRLRYYRETGQDREAQQYERYLKETGQYTEAPPIASAQSEPPTPERPGVLSRAASLAGSSIVNAVAHPIETAKGIVTAPVRSFLKTFNTPVEGEEVSSARYLRGKAGPAPNALPIGTKITKQNTPGAITPTEHRGAGAQTVAAIAGPAAFGPLSRVMGGGMAGQLGALATIGAGSGAAFTPDDPLAGAVAGGIMAPLTAGVAKKAMLPVKLARRLASAIEEDGGGGLSRGRPTTVTPIRPLDRRGTAGRLKTESALESALRGPREARGGTTTDDMVRSLMASGPIFSPEEAAAATRSVGPRTPTAPGSAFDDLLNSLVEKMRKAQPAEVGSQWGDADIAQGFHVPEQNLEALLMESIRHAKPRAP